MSYCLDLRGAAVSLDTACSSALVALDAAASRLTRGDEAAALVGAANVQLVASWSEAFVVAGMLSPRHRCAFGDDGADGYVRGEGVAFACVSATATAATAFVDATAVNQDGRSNGLTAPNPAAQARMLRAAVGSRRKLTLPRSSPSSPISESRSGAWYAVLAGPVFALSSSSSVRPLRACSPARTL